MKNKKKLLILMPFLLIIFLGISYAAFTYVNSLGNNEFIMGDLRFNYYDLSPNIKKTKVLPETKEEARDPSLHPTQSIMIDDYEYAYQDNELIFKVDCVSPLDDFYYSIGVTEGDAIEGKTRLSPKFIRLDFYEIDPDTHEETQILDNYSLLNNYFDEVLKVDQISTEEVRLYRIRFWYEDTVVISNSVETADYTATEFSNGYYSVKMHINASFDQHYYDYSYMRRYSSTEFWPNSINNIKNSVKTISFLKLTDQLLNEYTNATISYDATDYNYPNTKQIYVYTKNNDQNLVIASESLILFPSDSNHALANFMADNTNNPTDYYVDLDITNLDTSQVQDMSYFLYNVKNLRNITSSNGNHLKTPKVTTMERFLQVSSWIVHPRLTNESFAYLIQDFDTSNVTNMSYMFEDVSAVTIMDLRHFDVSKVTNMAYMFNDCSKVETINIDGWDTRSLTNMESMFDTTSKLKNIDLTQINTSNVTSMYYTFGRTGLPVIDITSWKTSKVGTMQKMFDSAKTTEINMAYLDVSHVTNFVSLFDGCTNLIKVNIDGFNFKTHSISSLFNGCSKIEVIDLSKTIVGNLNVSSTQHMNNMFNNCTKLKTIYINEGWNLPDTHATAYNMFTGCTSLVGAVPFDSAHVQNDMANYTTGYFTLKPRETIKNIHQYFEQMNGIEEFIITTDTAVHDRYLIANLSEEAALYKAGKKAYIVVSGITEMPEDCSYFFSGFPNLKEIEGLKYLDFSNTTNLSHLFDGDSSLTDFDGQYIKTNMVKDASYMFYNCTSLVEVNITGIELYNDNGQNNDNINYMFANCINLERIFADTFCSSRAVSSQDNYLYALKDCRKLKTNFGTSFGMIIDNNNGDYSRMQIISRLSKTEGIGIFSETNLLSMIFMTSSQSGESLNYASPPNLSDTNGFYNIDKGVEIEEEFIQTGFTIFYRGNYSPSFIFNDMCWKAISYNLDVDMNTMVPTAYVKMIYFGKPVVVNGKKTCPDTNGTNGRNIITIPDSMKGFSRTSATNYLGYMYGSANSSYALATNNTEDSLPKKNLEDWYEENNFEALEFYIEDAPYCSDRSIATGSYTVDGVSYTGNGTGYNDTVTVYAPYERARNHSPSLECPNVNDRFTVSVDKGNGKNKHPIGLMTSDELMMAGGVFKTYSYDLYFAAINSPETWTMSPAYYISSTNAQMMFKSTQNDTNNAGAGSWYGLQPVISLNLFRTLITKGSGEANSPYIIDEESREDTSEGLVLY